MFTSVMLETCQGWAACVDCLPGVTVSSRPKCDPARVRVDHSLGLPLGSGPLPFKARLSRAEVPLSVALRQVDEAHEWSCSAVTARVLILPEPRRSIQDFLDPRLVTSWGGRPTWVQGLCPPACSPVPAFWQKVESGLPGAPPGGQGGHPLAAVQHAAFPFSDAGSDSAGDLGLGRVDGWPWCGAEAHMDGVSVPCRCLRWRPVRWPSTRGS